MNWELLKNPLNWLIVGLMLTFAGIAGHIVLTHFGAQPNGPELGGPDLPPGEASKQQISEAILG